jgi:hypothetical protein
MLTNPDVRAAQAGQTVPAPSLLAERTRQACLFVWEHRVAVGSSLAAGLLAFLVSYLVGPTASSLALAAVGAAFASRPSRLWSWLIAGRAS